MKFLHIYFGLCTLLSVVFGIYAIKYGPYREMDIYMMNTIERDKEYYDEEMAVRLASTMWWGTDDIESQGISDEVVYSYPTNEWLVIFTRDDGEITTIIGVRRDNGKMEVYW